MFRWCCGATHESDHDEGCTLNAALTAAGLPDQASRDAKRAEPLAAKTLDASEPQIERAGYVILGDQQDVERIEKRHPELTFSAKPDGSLTKVREVWRAHDEARGIVRTFPNGSTREETDEEFVAHLKELTERPRGHSGACQVVDVSSGWHCSNGTKGCRKG